MESLKNKTTTHHFRVDTIALLHEIADNGLRPGMGVLKVPLNTIRALLAQCAQRCTEINDPVLNRIMFDMNLYETPSRSSPEYTKLMNKLYTVEKKFVKQNKKIKLHEQGKDHR